MNFLFLNSARRWGGNEHWTRLAIQCLSQNHAVHVAYRNEEIGRRFPCHGHRLPLWNELDPVSLFRLSRLIASEAIDVVIPTKRKDYVLAGLSTRRKHAKTVLRLGILRNLANNRVNRLVYDGLCDGIIVNSTAAGQALIAAGVAQRHKVRVIYNGVDVAAVEAGARMDAKIQLPFEFVIAAMGELSDRKGFDLLLQGLSRFLSDHAPSLRCGLVLLGEGPEEDRLRRLAAELGIQDQVHLAGFQDNPYPYLAKSNVFVMTSKSEGLPNAMLEAMALKIPVITTSFKGIEEVIAHEENGLIAENSDPGEFATKLNTLYENDGSRQAYGEAGYRTIQRQFSLDRMAREIEDFCRELGGRN